MKRFWSLLFITISLNVTAQTTFQRSVGGTSDDVGKSIAETSDGFVVGGTSTSFGLSSSQVYVLRFDTNGDTIWNGTFGYNTGYEDAYDIINLSDTTYSLVGFTTGYGATMGDGVLFQVDSAGSGSTTKRYAGGLTEYTRSICLTQDGNMIATGYTNSFGSGSNDIHVTKTNLNGNLLWSKTHGGTALEYGYSIDTTAGGGYYVSGATYSYGAGGQDFYVLKLDAFGDTVWTRVLGESGNDYGAYVAATSDGGAIVGGYTENFGAGYHDPVLIKLDANGNLEWSKMYSAPDREEVSHVMQTSDGGYLLTGFSETWGEGSRDALLIKTDALGDTLWTRVYGGSGIEEGFMSIETSDGGFAMTGYTESFGDGGKDVYLVKVDANGATATTDCHQGPALFSTVNITPLESAGGLNSSGVTIGTNGIAVLLQTPGMCDPCAPLLANFSSVVTGLDVDFTDMSGAGATASYYWDFGDGSTSTTQNPSHTYATDSIYQVCLIVSDGCASDSTCQTITVGCAAPSADFIYTDSVATYYDFFFVGIGGTTYFWDFGDGSTSTDMHPMYTYTTAGTYNVCVTAYNACDSTTYCDSVTTCPVPNASFTFAYNNPDIDFTNTSFAGSDYWWDFGDGFFSNVSDPSHAYAINGTYTVCLTVTNSCGSDTACMSIPIAIGINEWETGLPITVAPNPSNGQFKVQFDGDFESLHVYDVTGREIGTEFKVNGNSTEVSLNAGKGTYFLQLTTGQGTGTSMIVVR